MAGLLDNDFVRFLVAPRATIAGWRQEEDTKKFQGLLGSLEQQGPTLPNQGLLGMREPDQQFWLKAAEIPTYQQLAGQQLGYATQGQQAMDRQQQAQLWDKNNMTMAQTEQQKLQELRNRQVYEAEQRRLDYEGQRTRADVAQSYAAAHATDATRQYTEERTRGEQFRNKQLEQGVTLPLYAQLPPVERQKANVALSNSDTWERSAIDVEDWVERRSKLSAVPLVGSAEAAAFNTEWQSSVKPAFMQILNTGVLQGNEAEELQKIIGKPDDVMLTQSQINVIKTATEKVRNLRRNLYQSYGLNAPQQQVGGSSAARAISPAKPVGEVRPYAPPALPAPSYTPGTKPGGNIWDVGPGVFDPMRR